MSYDIDQIVNDPKAAPWELRECIAELRKLHCEVSYVAEAQQRELDAISAAIGTNDYLDPPDGGSVPLSEQVARMARDAERYRKLRRKARFEWRNGPGLYWYLPRGGERGLTAADRLDDSLDAEPT